MKIIFYLITIMFCMTSCNKPPKAEAPKPTVQTKESDAVIIARMKLEAEAEERKYRREQATKSQEASAEERKYRREQTTKSQEATINRREQQSEQRKEYTVKRSERLAKNREASAKTRQVRREAYGLKPWVIQHKVTQQRLALAFDYDGKTYKTEWVWDYVIVNGKFYFTVSMDGAKGLLDTKRINEEKTDPDVYAKAKKFAQYIKAKAKKDASNKVADVKKLEQATYNARHKTIQYARVYKVIMRDHHRVYYVKDCMSTAGGYSWPQVFSCRMTIHQAESITTSKPPHRASRKKKRYNAYTRANANVTLYTGANNFWYKNKKDAVDSWMTVLK